MPETIEIQLKKGVLTLCVLALLNRHDSYAYEIASTLSDAIDMGEGTIYPLMRRMQSDGQVETYLVESPSGPSRKYYRLTDAGRRALDAQTAEWGAFARAVESILAAPAEPAVSAGTTNDDTAERGAEQ
ncbi:MAG: PadR family transcriptional regulator [Alphaproteobacteria bacterium]|nr:PadR family transcriptional regulator [Alphaproteobacteria bacterium]MBU2043201.1 PadR family transcriptional regulator [Alphaproteobacteria bacterium]MBU2127157.1 PadR family transcriptional regulator [Alphaproteobacteria bacterium]MBU2209388.1 PadR family transcriptional regulator [Alphaproteobacteria bacterium]MBU2290260.1 PadR family transcriptional regulator [Alphaproteobacteria bacterium]